MLARQSVGCASIFLFQEFDIDRMTYRYRNVTRLSGFTVIELVVTLMVIGVLAVAVLPRLQVETFEARGFHDQTLAMVRYAQKAAVAQRTSVFVNSHAGSRTICLTYAADAACSGGTGVLNPADGAWFRKVAPDSVSLSTASFAFSGLGVPVPNAAVTINVVGDGQTRTITVERETGYVH
jgi:MSHA pilin protein MshC